MALPSAVQQQLERANKIQENLVQGTPVQVVEDKTNPDLKTEGEPSNQEPTQSPEQAQPVAPPEEENEGQQETWEHKYKVLQGMVENIKQDANGRADALQSQLNQANKTITSLHSLIDSSATPSQPQDSDQPAEDDVSATEEDLQPLNEEEFDGYGEEMVDFVKGYNNLVKINNDLRKKLGETGEKVDSVEKAVQASQGDTFLQGLDSAVPKWREINQSQEWLNWLMQPDQENGGVIRDNLLQEAQQNLDLNFVIKYLNNFLSETNQQPQSANTTQKSGLEGQVVPDETVGSDGPVSDGFRPITREQFLKAGKDVTTKRITPEQYQKIANDFQRTIREGKLR